MTPLQPVLAKPSPRPATTRPHPPQPGTASPIQPPRPLRQINHPTATGRPIPDHGGHSLTKRPHHGPNPKHRIARGATRTNPGHKEGCPNPRRYQSEPHRPAHPNRDQDRPGRYNAASPRASHTPNRGRETGGRGEPHHGRHHGGRRGAGTVHRRREALVPGGRVQPPTTARNHSSPCTCLSGEQGNQSPHTTPGSHEGHTRGHRGSGSKPSLPKRRGDHYKLP